MTHAVLSEIHRSLFELTIPTEYDSNIGTKILKDYEISNHPKMNSNFGVGLLGLKTQGGLFAFIKYYLIYIIISQP